MTTPRALVWILSLALGASGVLGTTTFFRTTLERFSYSNTLLVLLGLASLVFIWLDYFPRTEYLRS